MLKSRKNVNSLSGNFLYAVAICFIMLAHEQLHGKGKPLYFHIRENLHGQVCPLSVSLFVCVAPLNKFASKQSATKGVKTMSIERILELAWLKAIDNWAKEREINDNHPSEWQKQKEQIAWKEVKTIEYLRKEVEAAK